MSELSVSVGLTNIMAAIITSTTTNPPRAIAGSPGSRIRVILGETGSDYLVMCDEDDGTRERQSCAWKNIPDDLAKQINDCTAKGMYGMNFDFCSRTSAWFVRAIKRDGSGELSWCGGTSASETIINLTKNASKVQVLFGSSPTGDEQCVILIQGINECIGVGNCVPNLVSRMQRIKNSGKTIDCLRLFHDSGYFISDDEGSEWNYLKHISLANELSKPGKVNDVAVAGDGSWIVIRPDSYLGSVGLNKDLTNKLDRFYREQKLCMDIRSHEIQIYNAQVIERARQERERVHREREREKRKAAREATERCERERRERELEAEQACEKVDSAILASAFEESIKEELKSIEQQTQLNEQQKQLLRKRHCELKALIEKLPPAQQARIGFKEITEAERTDCVICCSASAIRAVSPCGHHCLCDDCADSLSILDEASRLCPLCRTPLQSTLKIFGAR